MDGTLHAVTAPTRPRRSKDAPPILPALVCPPLIFVVREQTAVPSATIWLQVRRSAERTRFRGLLDCGWVDVFRAHHPELQAFSWWDYRGGAFHRGQGLRIDFLLATPAVAARVRSVEIDRDYRKKKDDLVASDHAPVVADLD